WRHCRRSDPARRVSHRDLQPARRRADLLVDRSDRYALISPFRPRFRRHYPYDRNLLGSYSRSIVLLALGSAAELASAAGGIALSPSPSGGGLGIRVDVCPSCGCVLLVSGFALLGSYLRLRWQTPP